uniref:Uncharacterized protein n=1 Tax=Romanomermis culicivorax TaxID=13658 RepID=A0A915IV72_ROMCU
MERSNLPVVKTSASCVRRTPKAVDKSSCSVPSGLYQILHPSNQC